MMSALPRPRLMTALVALLLAGAGLTLLQSASSAAGTPVFNPATGHWYTAIPASGDGISWLDAKPLAEAMAHDGKSGYLATITSAAEQAWIQDQFPEAFQGHYLFGGFQPAGSAEPGGGWRWVTDEPWVYTNWIAGEPNEIDGGENITMVKESGGWNDDQDTETLGGYLVEFGDGPPPNTNNPILNPANDHWYLQVTAPAGGIKWSDARAAAAGMTHQGLTGYLATLTTAEEDNWVADTFPTAVANHYMLGGFQAPGSTEPEGGWGWITGETWNYTNWNAGEPNDTGGEEILTFWNNRRWEDAREEDNLNGYIVEFGLINGGRTGAPLAYVANRESDNVSVIDTGSDLVIDEIGAGDGPYGVALTPDGKTLYVANFWGGNVSVIDLASDAVTKTISIGTRPSQLELSPDGTRLLVPHNGGSGVSVIDTATNSAITTIGVELNPMAIAISPDSQFAYVANQQGDSVSVIDLGNNTVINTPEAGSGPAGIAIRPDGAEVYATNSGSDNVTVISGITHTAVATILVGDRPFGVTFSPDSSTAYVANVLSNSLSVIDTNTRNVIDTIPLQRKGGLLEINPDGTKLYITHEETDDMTVLDLVSGNQVLLEVRDFPLGIVIGQASGPPAAPASLQAAGLTSTSIGLAWNPPSQATSQEIESRTASTSFTRIATVAGTASSYTHNSLTTGTDYTYRVRALNSEGASPYSNEATARPSLQPPIAPSNLLVTALSKTSLRLNWQDNSANESGFKIERKPGGVSAGGAYTQVGTTGANVATFTNSNLTAESTYSYRVRATNGAGDSANSPAAAGTTLSGRPNAPTGLAVTTVSETALKLDWTDTSNNESGFRIERKPGKIADPGAYVQIGTAAIGVVTYTNSGLTGDASYSFRVRAYNNDGNSAYTNEADGTTAKAKPAAPIGLTAFSPHSTQVNLSWTDKSANENGFRVERKIGTGLFDPIADLNVGATNYADASAFPNALTTYRVFAYNEAGDSSPAEVITTSLAAPTDVRATATGSTKIELTWTDRTTKEQGFEIDRKLGGGAFQLLTKVAANVVRYAQSGLGPSTTYTYRVRAYNATAFSSYSAESGVTTLPAPTDLAAAVLSTTGVRLTWTDRSGSESGFKIEQKKGTSAFAEVGTVGANVATYDAASLTPGTVYSFRLRAYGPNSFSDFSNTATATTYPNAPPVPSPLTVAAVSTSELRLNWKDVAGEDGYRIQRQLSGGGWNQLAETRAGVAALLDTGLEPDTAYRYRVAAFNRGGESGPAEAGGRTLPPAPETPILTARLATPTSCRIEWTAAAGATGYELEKRTGTGAWTLLKSLGSVLTWTDSGLTVNTDYAYRVRAKNTGGYSSYSNVGPVHTLPPAPGAPRDLRAIATTPGRVDLTWTDGSTTEANFEVERKDGASGSSSSFARIAQTAANAHSYADSTAAPSKTYSYRVRAVNEGGASAYSNVATVTTPIGLISFTLRKVSVKGGKTVKGTVTLSGPAPPGNVVVTLKSDSPSYRGPASVTVKAGKTSANLTIKTKKTTASHTATITATLGITSKQAHLEIGK